MKKFATTSAALAAALLLPTFPAAPASAAAQDPDVQDVTQMKAEIQQLTDRLNALEAQLEKAGKDAGKADKKKAPELKWSGSTKIGYMYDQNKTSKSKGEIRLKTKTKVDDRYDVAFGLKFKATQSEGGDEAYPSEKNRVKLDEASVGRQFGPVYLKGGVQSATIGEGLWLGKSSINMVSAKYDVTPRDALYLGYGRDSQAYLAEETSKPRARTLAFLQYQHTFAEDALLGIYGGKQQPESYLGIYAETPVVGKLHFCGEFVHNTNTDHAFNETDSDGNSIKYGYKYYGSKSHADGYLLSLAYGKAEKKGDFVPSVNYFNVDQNLFMNSNYTSYDDYIGEEGFKGFGVVLDYMTSDHSKLSLERYWAHTKPDDANRKNGTGKSLEKAPYDFLYLKFTTKF